jgi:uncharacterized protein (TIGR03086 family)
MEDRTGETGNLIDVTGPGTTSDCRRIRRRAGGTLARMDGIIDRFRLAAAGFEARLRIVRAGDWARPTPCTEWDVRMLVNHMVRGNLNYTALVRGATAAYFVRMRDADALGADPLAAYRASTTACADTFDGALDREIDYPLGAVTAAQALAIRTTDTVVHTWDLARAVGGDEVLDRDLLAWIDDDLGLSYPGLDGAERFFAAPRGAAGPSPQERVLHRLGR